MNGQSYGDIDAYWYARDMGYEHKDAQTFSEWFVRVQYDDGYEHGLLAWEETR